MFKIVMMAAALLAPSLAKAQFHDPFETRYCQEYDGRPDLCSRVPGCSYDYNWDACRGQSGGGGTGGGNRACSAYDFDPASCNDQRNCEFDYHSNTCENSGRPTNPGNQCFYWNQDPRGCDAQPNCEWDRTTVSCQPSYHDPRPNPRQPVTTNVRCESGDYRQQRCTVYGQVTAAYLVRQFSSASCVQGRTWGYDYDAVWVSNGCRADFRVTYYPQF